MAKDFDVKSVADLACLNLEEEEEAQLRDHFERVMDYFKNLEAVNTSNVEPMVTPHDIHSPLRADEVKKDLSVEELLENAPDIKDSLFKVPPVV